MSERSKDSDKTRGMHKAQDNAYNEQAGGFKQVGPIIGLLKRLYQFDAIKTLVEPCRRGAIIAIYNPTALTAWLTISETVADPAAPAIGEVTSIALKPNDYTILAMPEAATKIRCSEATAIAYLVMDDSTIR